MSKYSVHSTYLIHVCYALTLYIIWKETETWGDQITFQGYVASKWYSQYLDWVQTWAWIKVITLIFIL